MLQVDGILGTILLLGYTVVSTIVKDNAILQNFAYAGTLVCMSSL